MVTGEADTIHGDSSRAQGRVPGSAIRGFVLQNDLYGRFKADLVSR